MGVVLCSVVLGIVVCGGVWWVGMVVPRYVLVSLSISVSPTLYPMLSMLTYL